MSEPLLEIDSDGQNVGANPARAGRSGETVGELAHHHPALLHDRQIRLRFYATKFGGSVYAWNVTLSARELHSWRGYSCTRGWVRLQYQANGRQGEAADVQKNAVLVTGAAGFGGSHLVRNLLACGHRVTGLDIVPPLHAGLLRRELEHPEFRYVWKSLQDIQPGDVKGHLVVAHLAAQADAPMAFDSPRYAVMQNIEGTVALLEAVRNAGGVRKMLFAGSGNEIGRPLTLPIDESHPLTPHNPYGFSKAAAELAVCVNFRGH